MSGAAAVYDDLVNHLDPSSPTVQTGIKGVNPAALEDILKIFSLSP
jgi:hypothetical protein